MKTVPLATQARKLIFIGTSLVGAAGAWADSFTLSPPSPTLPLIPAGPADILHDLGAPPPIVGVPFPALSLVPGDVVDAISDGFDPVFLLHTDYFSVTPGSLGIPGSGVAAEVALDTPPGLTPGHASDIFVTSPAIGPTNILAPAPFGWSLGTTTGDEANAGLINPGDNVNSYDLAFLAPGGPIFFSLTPFSPTLALLGYAPGTGGADIFTLDGPDADALPDLFLPAAAFGLPAAADIDAVALAVGGPPGFIIEYSLTTATSGAIPAALGSGATILGSAGAGASFTAHTPGSLGLLPVDDLDALDVDQQIIIPEPGAFALLALGGLLLARRPRRR